jgi:hypothetical protein
MACIEAEDLNVELQPLYYYATQPRLDHYRPPQLLLSAICCGPSSASFAAPSRKK